MNLLTVRMRLPVMFPSPRPRDVGPDEGAPSDHQSPGLRRSARTAIQRFGRGGAAEAEDFAHAVIVPSTDKEMLQGCAAPIEHSIGS